MDSSTLRELASDQTGLFTIEQARQCGFTDYQIRRRLASGEWQRVAGRTLAPAGWPVTPRALDRALALALPDAILAGASAARVHGIPTAVRGTCVLTRSKAVIRAPGLRVLREPVTADDVVLLDELLVTCRARTVFDLLRATPTPQAVELLDRALQQHWITVPDLAARVRMHAGRRGAPALVALVRHAASGAQSQAERVAVTLVRRSGLTGWVANADIRDATGRLVAVGDIVFPGRRLVIEIDGRAHHVTPGQFQRDRERQNHLVAAGWTVLRFTWSDLTTQPERVIRTIVGMLGRGWNG